MDNHDLVKLTLASEHVWGDVEIARFTGNPYRRCKVDGCNFISLDLDEEEEYEPSDEEKFQDRIDVARNREIAERYRSW